jgi:serine/threonine-protein kinase
MVLGRQPFISDNPADAIQMHLCATAPRPSILWKEIPPKLESLLMKLLAKNPDERATLSDVRATLAALRPTVTPALDRVDDAPPPPAPPSRHRHTLRLAAVAVSFVVLAFASYWPAKLRAQRLHADLPARAPVAAEVVAPSLTPVIGAALPAVAPTPPVPASPTISRPSTHRARKRHHDGNYLLDPFTR